MIEASDAMIHEPIREIHGEKGDRNRLRKGRELGSDQPGKVIVAQAPSPPLPCKRSLSPTRSP
jgi:hypothetical protein